MPIIHEGNLPDFGAPIVRLSDSSIISFSHHGKDPQKIEQLRLIEQEQFRALNHLLTRLRGTTESGGNLLDGTAILFGSNLGNASAHSTDNLPILLAGGGFKHGHHLAHDATHNTALSISTSTSPATWASSPPTFPKALLRASRGWRRCDLAWRFH